MGPFPGEGMWVGTTEARCRWFYFGEGFTLPFGSLLIRGVGVPPSIVLLVRLVTAWSL